MPRFQNTSSHNRGSAVVLVIVTLVLMTLIGAVYLQSTSVQRFAVSKVEGDIDMVAQATFTQIMAALAQDLTDEGDRTEWHDYPWTNDDAGAENRWQVSPFFRSSADARGGYQDNAWLASTAPVFGSDPNLGTWEHITNLNGFYLRAAGSDPSNLATVSNAASASSLHEDIVDFSDVFTQPHDLEVTWPVTSSSLLVDADGDGIPDSRWTWAAIPQINGFFYTAAIRVVDLSSLVNINVWQSQVTNDEGTTYTSSYLDAPRWDRPSEIDLGGFILGALNGIGLTADRFHAFLNQRFDPAGSLTDAFTDRSMRRAFWNQQGRFFAAQTDYQFHGISSEYELRRRHGLSNTGGSAITASIENPAALGPLLREGADELKWHDTPYDASLLDYFTAEPRHQLTTLSGSAPLAPKLPGDTGTTGPILKQNINSSTVEALYETLATVLNGADPANLPGQFDRISQLAAQLAVNIKAYTTTGNEMPEITLENSDGTTITTYYGLKALPMLVEVYVQRPYVLQNAVDNGDGTYNLIWNELGKAGYAIELGNPYRRPIAIDDNVELWIQVPGVGETRLGTLAELTGLSELIPGESIVLYRNSDDGDHDDLTSLIATTNLVDLTIDPAVPVVFDWPAVAAHEEVIVQLRGRSTSGPMDLPYSKIDAKGMPTTLTQNNLDTGGVTPISITTDPANAHQAYQQIFRIGNGEGVNMLLHSTENIDDGHDVRLENLSSGPSYLPTYKMSTDHLGEISKPNSNLNPGVVPTTGTGADQIILSHREMEQIGELAHITTLGMRVTRSILTGAPTSDPDAIMTYDRVGEHDRGSAPGLNKIRLNFDPDTADLIETGSPTLRDAWQVPYAAALLDRFTTYSSHTSNGEAQHIIPGLINLNTMPEHLMAQVLPIADEHIREGVAKAIVNYRSNPSGRSSARENNPGIAMLGELFSQDSLFVDPQGDGSVPAFNAIADANSGSDTRVIGLNNTPIDFLSNPSNTTGDGIGNDREELYQIASWLSQVGSVRSDFFVAYLYLQEFQGTDWTSGPTNQRRYVAVLRRNPKSGNVTVEKMMPASTDLFAID